jgi:hypothetical protein
MKMQSALKKRMPKQNDYPESPNRLHDAGLPTNMSIDADYMN